VRNADIYNLLNVNAGGLELTISPNPLVPNSQIQIKVPAGFVTLQPLTDFSLTIYDEQGQRIINLTPRLRTAALARGEDSVTLAAADRPRFVAGRNYFCRFTVGNYAVTKIVRVQ
jgi:hypothetical protein